jgi:alpha-ketoglutarate-dependent taurine dioxygenase
MTVDALASFVEIATSVSPKEKASTMIWERTYSAARPSSAFSSLVEAWESDENKVFVLRTDDEVADMQAFLMENFRFLGKPVPLAEDVKVGDRDHQRTGELWFEVRYDPRHPNAYRHSSNAQPLHTDGSYIPDFPNATLLSCVANAGEGGETTFIDAADVVAALEAEDPGLLRELMTTDMPHARSGDSRTERIIEKRDGKYLVNWNYYCVAPTATGEQRALADRFFAFLDKSPMVRERTKGVLLTPGDAVTWKDREVLHGRNAFSASKESERFIWKCAIDIGNFDG